MNHTAIFAESLPRPKAPLSPAVVAGSLVFVSGQTPVEPKNGAISEDFQEQARQCFMNMKEVLEAAGSSFDDIVKVTVYLTDLTCFPEFNEVYREFFPGAAPARTTVGAQLNRIKVEVDCIAVKQV